jgi:hypothetical protein
MSSIDILNIDQRIKKEFSNKYLKIENFKKNIEDLKITLNSNDISESHKLKIKKILEKLKNEIDMIESENDLYIYISRTASLVDKYKKILNTPVQMSFIGNGSKKSNREKNNIISKYLNIAQDYINLKDEKKIKSRKKIRCDNCNNYKNFDIIENSIYICLNCGSQQEIILHTSSYKDVDRINISCKYTYDRKIHFRDCMNQYQGKQNSSIDKKILIMLENEFENHHLLKGSVGMDRKYRFSNITKRHIHLFLKELGFTKHYENVNLIHNQLTGKKLDDISHLEDKLLNDFDKLTNLYDKKFKYKLGFERKNFINTQYVLYQLLLRHKHHCKQEDFTILKTVDRKSFHDDIAKMCFEELGWNHTPLF